MLKMAVLITPPRQEAPIARVNLSLIMLLAEPHDDERNNQPVERDGLDQRESDPHVLADTSLRFRLTRDRLDHLSKDISDAYAGSGKPGGCEAHAQQCCGC